MEKCDKCDFFNSFHCWCENKNSPFYSTPGIPNTCKFFSTKDTKDICLNRWTVECYILEHPALITIIDYTNLVKHAATSKLVENAKEPNEIQIDFINDVSIHLIIEQIFDNLIWRRNEYQFDIYEDFTSNLSHHCKLNMEYVPFSNNPKYKEPKNMSVLQMIGNGGFNINIMKRDWS